ncbi:MAG: phosphoenolpyruvate carboxykinase (GTP) [Candidatus Brocadiaceae bacterium]
MAADYLQILRDGLDEANYAKLTALDNPKLHRFVADAIALCTPESVFVATDDPEEIAYVRRRAIELAEERELATEGHTVHFDGYHDQARDKEHTCYLVEPGRELGERLNTVDKESGVREVRRNLAGAMEGKEMFVRFFCLGPRSSEFSIPCVQMTDSAYVAHSEDLLYRQGYETFRSIGDSEDFFRFIHSAGELVPAGDGDDGAPVSKLVERRRIYIDLDENLVYSTNTQYGGNTIGLKKLALRLAIQRAEREGWLAEHMLLMGVHGPRGRVTYLAGAFPSYCGKTSTAMAPGETVVGDDIAYLRKREGRVVGANVENGIFGIIQDVNSTDDPIIWEVLNSPGEIIFSNVLVTPEGEPYWVGHDAPCPEEGVNHSGRWHPGNSDEEGNEIPPSHKNARYTIRLESLPNCDPGLEKPEGVPIGGFVYGGRDSDTWVPVEQSLNWAHGIVTKGASLESETTAATLGEEGVRRFNLMAIMDFVAIPLGRYIQNNLDFARGLDSPPLVFGVNYFLRGEDNRYLNGMADKRVWLKWMELRVHGDTEAIETATGLIPRYDTLRQLFHDLLGRDFSEEDYARQFSTRVPQHLAKLDRIERIYRTQVDDTPGELFRVLADQRRRLEDARDRLGDLILPTDY